MYLKSAEGQSPRRQPRRFVRLNVTTHPPYCGQSFATEACFFASSRRVAVPSRSVPQFVVVMSRHIYSWLLIVALLYVWTRPSCGTSTGCDLSNPTSLTACVRNVIESSRPALKSRFDPFHVKNHSGGDSNLRWSVKDVVINGLSEFTIGKLDVRLEGSKIAVKMHVSWPKIAGKANAHVHKCHLIDCDLGMSKGTQPQRNSAQVS